MSTHQVLIKEVESIYPHPNADRMEFVKVGGWACLVPKDQFQVGEQVIYVQPDSVLPDEFQKRFQITYLRKGGRVGVVKLRGEFSEGLVLKNLDNKPLGSDVAEFYGIIKWEPPQSNDPLMRQSRELSWKKKHEDFLKYTDVERLQNHTEAFQPLDFVYATEKIHGMNFRAGWVKASKKPFLTRLRRSVLKILKMSREEWDWDFVVGSHNVEDPSQEIFHKLAKEFELREKIPYGYIFYGELYGPGIQPGFDYGLEKPSLIFFDVCTADGKFKPWAFTESLMLFSDLPVVPVLWKGLYMDFDPVIAEGMTVVGDAKHIREGVVLHSQFEKWEPGLGRVILKVISKDYLAQKTEGKIEEVSDDTEVTQELQEQTNSGNN